MSSLSACFPESRIAPTRPGLPEIVTSVESNVRGRDDVAIANVIGSNPFNVLTVLGLNALVAPLPISRRSQPGTTGG